MQRQVRDISRLSSGQDRFTSQPRAVDLSQAVNSVLSKHEHIYNHASLLTTATIHHVSRIITDLGRRHSGEAACAAFHWFRTRSLNLPPCSWQRSCIAACVHNGDLEVAERLYASILDSNQMPTLSLLNVLIVGCCNQGKVEKALQVRAHPLLDPVSPEMDAGCARLLMRYGNNMSDGANQAKGVACSTFNNLRFLKRGGSHRCSDTAAILKNHLLQTVQTAIRKAPTVKDAMKCFVGLQHLGLERQTCVFNTLLQRVSQGKTWEKVLHVFRYMLDTGVSMDTDTYNALIGACIRGGRVSEGFQIFEWMVAGCGNDHTIPQTPETLCLLLQGCHQAGALEKALEVLSWMRLSHIKPSTEMYTHLQDTIDIVQLWDQNVLESNTGAKDTRRNTHVQTTTPASQAHTTITPEQLRPAPFDGRRASYASRQPEQTEDALLAGLQLPNHTWVPSTMQPLTFDARSKVLQLSTSHAPIALSKEDALNFIATFRMAKKRLLPDVHAKWIPYDKRHARKDLHPWIPEPNRVMEGMIGYSMTVLYYLLSLEPVFLFLQTL